MAAPNASSITFDLSGFGAQLATNIGGTMDNMETILEKLSEQLSTSQDRKAEEVDISGTREQILANVEVLFPVLYQGASGPTYLPSEPKFHLITRGRGTDTYGCVLFSFPITDGIIAKKDLLIAGPFAPSMAQALSGLHDSTRRLLDKMSNKYEDYADNMGTVADNGGFYSIRRGQEGRGGR